MSTKDRGTINLIKLHPKDNPNLISKFWSLSESLSNQACLILRSTLKWLISKTLFAREIPFMRWSDSCSSKTCRYKSSNINSEMQANNTALNKINNQTTDRCIKIKDNKIILRVLYKSVNFNKIWRNQMIIMINITHTKAIARTQSHWLKGSPTLKILIVNLFLLIIQQSTAKTFPANLMLPLHSEIIRLSLWINIMIIFHINMLMALF